MQEEGDESTRVAGLAAVYHAMGRTTESNAALARLTQRSAKDWASGIAGVHAFRGELNEAFGWLDKAYARKEVDLARFVFKRDPIFRNLEHDPRYKVLLHKMNLSE
jgi:hypothetical protein